jgi:glycosyltransferase involved in cell wall biosynthesis
VKISVVIPTCGRRDLLERTLRSLAAQQGAPPAEFLVVDDGADPGLADHVARTFPELPVHVEHHPENRGRSATRNSGIARATGDVVVFLDGDMEVVPRFLAAHAAAQTGEDVVVLGNIRTAPEIARSAFVRYIDTRGVQKIAPGEPIPPRYFMTGNSSVAAALLARSGGFDEDFREYGGEDTEMGYRLGAHGARFRYAPGAVSWHLDLNSVPRMAERLRRYGERSLPILVAKVPEARRDLHLDLAEPLDPAREGAGRTLVKIASRLVCRRAFWRPLSAVADALPAGIRAEFLFDLVRASAYLDGYAQALRGPASETSSARGGEPS